MSNTVRKPRYIAKSSAEEAKASIAFAAENGENRDEALARIEGDIPESPTTSKQEDATSDWLNWLADQLEWADDASDEQESGSKIERTMRKYRSGYVPTLAASGKKSLCNGDPLALAMAGASHEAIAHAADKLYADIDKWDGTPHLTKYAHLNNGQIRMNSGNRIRGAIKRGDATQEQALAAIEYAIDCHNMATTDEA